MHIKNKRLIILISAIAALLVIGGFFIMRARSHKSSTATTQAPDQNASDGAGLPRQSETTSPDNQSSSSTSGGSNNSSSTSVAPTKPTLNKSSGNAGPIPSGAVVNFVCTSAAGTSCDIIITSKGNNSNVIKLGAKQVASTYGQAPFASWDWTSMTGDWTVVARASNGSATADSDAQGLKVQ